MSEILKTIREWIEIQGKELLAAADAHNREDQRVEAGKYNMLKAVENLIETSSPWRNFRKERPAGDDACWVYADCWPKNPIEVTFVDRKEGASTYLHFENDWIIIPCLDYKWIFWMHRQRPAPPTAAEIEAAMKGDGNAG